MGMQSVMMMHVETLESKFSIVHLWRDGLRLVRVVGTEPDPPNWRSLDYAA